MMICEYFRPTVNYNSWSDRFSSTWTFVLLLILSVVTAVRHYMGPNTICKAPDQFTRHTAEYIDETCWLSRQMMERGIMNSPLNDAMPFVSRDHEILGEGATRTLYQWLPLILALQALLFRLPDIVLKICESSFGFGCQKLNGFVNGYNSLSSADRKSHADEIAKYLNQIFSARPLKVIPFGVITIIVAFVKLLFFINAVTQLAILEGYLSAENVTSYGQYALESITSRNYSQIAVSPVFPREVLCTMMFFTLQGGQKFSFQCLIPVNEFNEHVCLFVWIWLLVVCIAAGTSGILFLVRSLLPMIRQRYVKKYLTMGDIMISSQDLSTFSGTVIGQDGVLILTMIGDVSSDILVRDIILKLWHIHRSPNPPNVIEDERYPLQQPPETKKKPLEPEMVAMEKSP